MSTSPSSTPAQSTPAQSTPAPSTPAPSTPAPSTPAPSTPAPLARLLADALAREPGRPLLTYYDDATGERTELSVATFDNWVAKTSNLIVDGLGLGPGARVALMLPLHWQTAVWFAACWKVGAVACFGNGGADIAANADLAVAGPDTLDAALASDEVVAMSLLAWGGPFTTSLPAGVVDYASEVAGYGDRFVAANSTRGATEFDGTVLSSGALVDAAVAAAQQWSLGTHGRLLSTLAPASLGGLLALLPAALAVDGSVVMARNYDEGTAEQRLSGEKVTATAHG